ncbi:MAG: DUF1614 domain-containing protein [Negativicutes bacterium]|nr:DUF1614 domain-containing protein [Negativicutes bacterium]
MSLPIGMIVLLVVGVLVYFGVAQRILDRMRLTDKQALAFIAAIIVGSFINIPISRTPVELTVNVGGALLPAILAVWLIVTADETSERIRAVAASVLVMAAVLAGSLYLPYEPENMFMDPKLIYGIAAGIIAYLAGRSRRSAYIGGTLGIVLSDIAHYYTITRAGIPGTTSIGGAGAFDVVIIAGIFAVMIAELVGETREKIQGGPVLGPNRPEGLYEFSEELHKGKEGTGADAKKPENSTSAPNRQKRGGDNE